MIKREGKLYSILHLKCPQCHEGSLFSVANPYLLNSMLDMPHYCPVCHQDLLIEPGFYSGALWASFPLVVIAFSIVWFILAIGGSIDGEWSLGISAVAVLFLQPLIMRYGRSIWINVFIEYKAH